MVVRRVEIEIAAVDPVAHDVGPITVFLSDAASVIEGGMTESDVVAEFVGKHLFVAYVPFPCPSWAGRTRTK